MTTNVKRLTPAKWLETVEHAAKLRLAKQKVNKASREADALWNNAKTVLMAALDGATYAKCANYAITVSRGAESQATLTLDNGTVIPWNKVKSIVLSDNTTVNAKHVSKMYGGRSGGTELEIIEGE